MVTVNGAPSNGSSFSVTGGTLAGTVTKQSDGSAVAGSTVQALQNGKVQATRRSGTDGTYSISNLTPGTYDVEFSASGLGTNMQTGVSVASGTTTLNASLSSPGAISGQLTQSGGSIGIGGAGVTVTQNGDLVGSATTDGNGNYTVSGLGSGSYSVQASAVGFVAQTQGGVSVTGGSTTTQNFSLVGSITVPIKYVYDELGRLAGAVDPSSNTAAYAYDPVGNLLSISRFSSAQTAVINFVPSSGPVGTVVTINGSNFSATPGQNTVTFNGTSATINSATTTKLVATVPPGATTGAILVTSPGGSATSANSFTVGVAGGTPTITSFTPNIALNGATITIAGTNFDSAYPNNRVRFNPGTANAAVTGGTTTSLTAAVSPLATSGHVTLITPGGTTNSGLDFFVPPSPHVVSDVVFTGRSGTAQSQTISLSTTNQIGLLLFEAVSGQGISVNINNVSGSASAQLHIYAPDGSSVYLSPSYSASGLFAVVSSLPQTGTYTIMPNDQTPAAISGTYTPYNIPLNPSAPISINGSSTTLNVNVPGQNAQATFTGTAGQSVTVHVTNSTLGGGSGNGQVFLLSTDGSTVLTALPLWHSPNFTFSYPSLPANGTYTILVNPSASGPITGSLAVNVTNP